MNIHTKIGVRKKVSINNCWMEGGEKKGLQGQGNAIYEQKKSKKILRFFLLIDDYTHIIGILCRSTLDFTFIYCLGSCQMNDYFQDGV